MSKISSQQAVDRLAVMAAKIDKYKIELTLADGTVKEQTLKQWLQNIEGIEIGDLEKDLQDLITLVGSYAADDIDGNLDVNAPVIKNLSIAVSNINAALKRISDNEGKISIIENTKADKTTTDALQSDINDIIEAILSQEVWKGDFALPLPSSDNVIPWSADITNALNGLEAGQKITLKLQNMAGDPVSIFLEESVNDNSFTSESFNGDANVQVKVTTAQFELNGLRNQERGDYKLLEIRSVPAEVKIDLSNLATIDLSNVNVGVANAGKILEVDATGKIVFLDAPSSGGGIPDQIRIESGTIEDNFDTLLDYYKKGNQITYNIITALETNVSIVVHMFKKVLIPSTIFIASSSLVELDLTDKLSNTKYFLINPLYK